MKKSYRIATMILSSMMLVEGVTGCASTEKTEIKVNDTAYVNVKLPEKKNLSIKSDFIATIESSDSVNVVTLVSGEVQNVNVKVGDQVEVGDILANIDDTSYQIALASAKITQDTAQHSYNISYGEGADTIAEMNSSNKLDTATDTVEDNQTSMVDNMDDLQHYKDLVAEEEAELDRIRDEYGFHDKPDEILEYFYDEGITPADEGYTRYTVANSLYNTAKNKIDSYKSEIDKYEKAIEDAEEAVNDTYKGLKDSAVTEDITQGEIREEQKSSSTNAIASAALNVKSANDNLEKCTIKANVSGIVETVDITEHEYAASNKVAFTIVNKSTMQAVYYVSEDDRNVLTLGQEVTVKKDDKTYQAQISEIGNSADQTIGLFKIKADLQGEVQNLMSGTNAVVTSTTFHEDNILCIPYDAVYFDNGDAYVYVATENTASRRDVTVGINCQGEIAILDGLTAEDQVITTWSAQLKEGSSIQIQEE